MGLITDERLVRVLARYERGVDRALDQVQADADADAEVDSPEPIGPDPGGANADDATPSLGEPGDAEEDGDGAGRAVTVLRAAGGALRTVRDRVVEPAVDRAIGALRGRSYPGHPDWAQVPVARRADWWIDRIAAWAAGPTALPWVAGKLSDRLPVKDALSAAAQGLVVCAVAREYGVTDRDDRVSLLAALLTGRDIPPQRVARLLAADHEQPPAGSAARTPADPKVAAAIDAEVDATVPERRRGPVRRAARTLWSLVRVVGELEDVLDHRQKGLLLARAVGFLPVVGVVGGYVAEHTALKRMGAATERKLQLRRSP